MRQSSSDGGVSWFPRRMATWREWALFVLLWAALFGPPAAFLVLRASKTIHDVSSALQTAETNIAAQNRDATTNDAR